MWTLRHQPQNQEGTATGTSPLAPPASTTQATPPAPTAAEIEQWKGAATKLAALEAAQANEAKKARDAQLAAAAEAEKSGNLQAALDAHKARVAELEPAAAKAAKWEAFEANELKRINEAAAKLPEAAQKAIAAAPDLDTKLTFLNAFSTGAGVTVHKPAASGGPPAAASAVNVEELIAKHGIAFVKANHPTEWAATAAQYRPAPAASGAASHFIKKK